MEFKEWLMCENMEPSIQQLAIELKEFLRSEAVKKVKHTAVSYRKKYLEGFEKHVNVIARDENDINGIGIPYLTIIITDRDYNEWPYIGWKKYKGFYVAVQHEYKGVNLLGEPNAKTRIGGGVKRKWV